MVTVVSLDLCLYYHHQCIMVLETSLNLSVSHLTYMPIKQIQKHLLLRGLVRINEY